VPLPEHQAEWAVAQYLDLETRLLNILSTIPYRPENYGAIIPALASVVVDAGTLVDSVCRAVTQSGRTKQNANITDFADDLEPLCRLSELHTMLYAYPPQMLTPFAAWRDSHHDERPSPGWWTAHNQLKHNRLAHLDGGTLQNAVGAACGVHQLLVSSADFFVPLMRHDMLHTNMRTQPWVASALLGSIEECDAMVESKLFVTCVGLARFPSTIEAIDPSRYVSKRGTRLEQFLANEVNWHLQRARKP